MDCRVCPATGDMWPGMACGGGAGGFSQESEHDLAMMVSDFLENGSSGPESRYSSDSDSGFSDLLHLADKISRFKMATDQSERDLLSVVHSRVLSIKEMDLHLVKSGICKASCIRFSLVKLLRLSGFDAGLCASKWQAGGKVPGGDHEYIDVINYSFDGSCERLIIDVDFRSHFEIARAVESYDRILSSLPVIYVGSLTKLKQLLQVMVEAARASLGQNSMPLPPWRSLAYLQSKWESPYQRKFIPEESVARAATIASEHKQCGGYLKRLHLSLQAEIETERLLKPMNSENTRLKRDRRRHSSIRTF